jgi:hypothetical protein
MSASVANPMTIHPMDKGMQADIMVRRRPITTQSGQERQADMTDISGTMEPKEIQADKCLTKPICYKIVKSFYNLLTLFQWLGMVWKRQFFNGKKTLP